MSRLARKRLGFTLIEMLVVIAIIAALAAMTVFFFPSFSDAKRAGNGAGQLQGWLYQAKQRAFRDQAPRGIRLFKTGNLVTQCQFIEQPEDFTGGNLSGTGNTVTISGMDVRQGELVDKTLWLIQAGDYLEIQGVGLAHLITDVNVVGTGTVLTLLGGSPIPYDIAAPGTPHYRIMRAPRVVGDEPLEFPEDVAIDLQTNATYNNPLPVGSAGIDVLFSPSGKVITPGVTTDFMALWVRDTSGVDVFDKAPTIMAVHVRSGLIAGHPPAPGGSPYQYIIDGKSRD